MSNYAISLKRSSLLLAALAFTAVLTAANFASIFSARVGAAQVSSRSLTLSSSLPGTETGDGIPGSETNGSAATHTIAFTANVSSTSLTLSYCTTAIGTCAEPAGLDLTNATVGALTNASGTITDAAEVLTLSGGVTGAGATSIEVTGIVNPTDKGTFFVRIASDSDEGTVAASITEGIFITSRVVETLGFSATADMVNGVIAEDSSCDALTGSGAIMLGDPTEHTLSITETFDALSAFRLYTNSANGTVVQYTGQTLEKGSDEITAIGVTPAVSAPGTEQFGLAVQVDNHGITNADTAFGGTGQLAIESDYANGEGTIDTTGTAAQFVFVANAPQTIATSSQYVECDTAVVRYMANISPLTPAGTYTTTIVYSAVPTY